MLLVAFLAGTFSSLAAVSRGTFVTAYEQLPADFRAMELGQVNFTYPNVTRALSAVPGVASVEPFVGAATNDGVFAWGTGEYFLSKLQAVNASVLNALPALEGRIPGNELAVVLHRAVAQTFGVTLGSVVYYRNSYLNRSTGQADWAYLNLTVVGLYGNGLPPSAITKYGDHWETLDDVPTYLSLAALDAALRGLHIEPGVTLFAYYFVRADRSVVNPDDLHATKLNLARVETLLKDAGRPWGLFFENMVEPLISQVRELVAEQEAVFTATGSPLIAFSLVLAFLSSELAMRPRFYEFSVMKARGADDRFLSTRVLAGSALAGIGGGAAGLLIGSAAAAMLWGREVVVSSAVDPGVFVALLLLGVGISLLATIGPLKALRAIPLARSIADPRAASEWNPATPAKILWGATIGSGVVALGLAYLAMPSRQGIDELGPLLVFFGPLLMAAFVVNILLSRGSRWFSGLSRALGPIAGPARLPFIGSAKTHARQTTTLTIAMTMGLSFAFLVGIVGSSQADYDRRLLQAQLGADLVIGTAFYDVNLTANLTREPRIAAVSSSANLLSDRYPIVAIDAANFSSATFISKEHFLSGSLDTFYQMASGPIALATKAFADRTGLQQGDVVRVGLAYTPPSSTTQDRLYDFEIGGVVTFLPGVGRRLWGYPQEYLAVDFRALQPDLLPYHLLHAAWSSYYVRVAEGADARAIADSLASRATTPMLFDVFQEELAKMQSDSVRSSVSRLLAMEALYASFLLAGGMAMVLALAGWDRRLELGTLVARGCDRSDIFRLSVAEASLPLTQAALVGLPLGLLGAALFEYLLDSPAALVHRSLVVDAASMWLPVGLIILTALLSASAAAAIAGRTMREGLRLRVIE